MWSHKGRRIAPFIEHFPGSRYLVDCFIHITWPRSFNAWSPPGRLLGMFSSGASVRSKRKVSFLCSSKEGRHGTVLKWMWYEPLLSPQSRAEPSQATPGCCSFHIKLPCLASGQHRKEILKTERLGDQRLSLNQMLTPTYFCSHFLREIWKGDKDGQTTWLVLQLWMGTKMLSKRIAKYQSSMGCGNYSSNNENSLNLYQRDSKTHYEMNSLAMDLLCYFTTGLVFKHYPQTFWLPPGQSPGYEEQSHLGKSTDLGNKTSVEEPIELRWDFRTNINEVPS